MAFCLILSGLFSGTNQVHPLDFYFRGPFVVGNDNLTASAFSGKATRIPV
jgi:hypothetical protein